MVKKILQIIRSGEWWEYKLAPLLAIAYATDLISGVPLVRVFPHLILLFLGVLVGAVYVSIINDITDAEEDAACGKFNRMAKVPRLWRWIIPACCLAAGGIFEVLLYPDKTSMVLYALPWIAFSLYSFPPFRLKKRGFWGILADAAGSHLFISLFMVSGTVYFTKTTPEGGWILAIGIWALLFGLRGILFHQFADRENDIKAGLNTYATAIAPSGFRRTAFVILLAEMAAFAFIIWKIHYLLPVFAFIVYTVVALVRLRFFGYTIINILAPEGRPFQIWMADYYQFFFPLSLLVIAAFSQPLGYVPLIVHCLLFPQKIWLYGKEAKYIVLG